MIALSVMALWHLQKRLDMETNDTHTPPPELTQEFIAVLFDVTREALTQALTGDHTWLPELQGLPQPLHEPGASFVTLYTRGELHGCIGSVEPKRPLAHDVAHNAVSSAFKDPRFPPLQAEELPETAVELSILSPLRRIHYDDLDDLIAQLLPEIHGVLVEQKWQRGLLLPQVWLKIPDPKEFLYQVALKASANLDIYTMPDTKVFSFQVHHYTQSLL